MPSTIESADLREQSIPLTRVIWGYLLGIGGAFTVLLLAMIAARASGLLSVDDANIVLGFIGQREFLLFLVVGFLAQVVDGSLGMAYGITSTSFLIGAGVPPATASAAVHVSEVFTTAASGISHWRFGNVDFKLFRRLAIPGIVGAVIGAYVLSASDASVMRPVVALYLLVMGIIILRKAFRKVVVTTQPTGRVGWLALIGGFADSSGGGGWGSIVVSTLIGSGSHPKKTIGTVNASEFLVALASAGTFTYMLGSGNWTVVLGLIIGGVLAAPLGAYVCHRINVRAAMGVVGVLIIFLSTRTVLKALDVWPFF
jgi:uncharacterized membrane protein YfcA